MRPRLAIAGSVLLVLLLLPVVAIKLGWRAPEGLDLLRVSMKGLATLVGVASVLIGGAMALHGSSTRAAGLLLVAVGAVQLTTGLGRAVGAGGAWIDGGSLLALVVAVIMLTRAGRERA